MPSGPLFADEPRRRAPDFAPPAVGLVLIIVLFLMLGGQQGRDGRVAGKLVTGDSNGLTGSLPYPHLVIGSGGVWRRDGAVVSRDAAIATFVAGDRRLPVYIVAEAGLAATELLDALQAIAPSGRQVVLVTSATGRGTAP